MYSFFFCTYSASRAFLAALVLMTEGGEHLSGLGVGLDGFLRESPLCPVGFLPLDELPFSSLDSCTFLELCALFLPTLFLERPTILANTPQKHPKQGLYS